MDQESAALNTAAATHSELETSTEDLVREAQRGARAPFEELYRRYYPPVVRRISHLVGPAGAASVHDLAQETFLRAYRALGQLRAGGERCSFAGWVLRIATNAARDHYRQHRRRPWRLWRRADDEQAVAARAQGVDQSYPTLQAVHRALEQISPKLREAVILFELEELSLAEMASLLEVPLHTAASRVRRGREELRAALERMGWQPGAAAVGADSANGAVLCGSELR
jgi:RNA polymerase sigma-70 factor (ECF subfamily)